MKQFNIFLITILFFSCNNNEKKDSKTENINYYNANSYNYITVDDSIKMSYLDVGEKSNPIVLLVHGEPNYSFVYRNIIPQLVNENYRVIVPDLIGFGHSDKLNNFDTYTYSNHTKWLSNFIHKLELTDIRLFAHDWGGMIALRIVASQPNIFNRVAVSYSYLFEGDEKIPESFLDFKNYALNEPSFSAGQIMDWGSKKPLSDSVKTKYDEPFKTESDLYAVRKFPSLIPTDISDSEAIINRKLNKQLYTFNKPFITIWGNHEDEMWQDKNIILQENIPGASNREHYILDAGHFIQEDQPERLSEILISFF